MADALRRRVWAERLSWIALALSVGAVAAALIAATGSGQGAWHFRSGFMVLRYALFAAAAGILLALIALFLARRGARPAVRWTALIGLLVGLAFVLYLGNQVRMARSVPAIHDATTNLDDYPRFYRLTVRRDNLDNVPTMDRPDLERMAPRQRWAQIHREHYGDLRTLHVPWTVPETIQRAEALARERGWDIATSDPRAGILEAVDTSAFFRFKDNVLVRARPAPQGGTHVDMRSISRVGGSDIGVNAKRIRAFLADLRQAQG